MSNMYCLLIYRLASIRKKNLLTDLRIDENVNINSDKIYKIIA